MSRNETERLVWTGKEAGYAVLGAVSPVHEGQANYSDGQTETVAGHRRASGKDWGKEPPHLPIWAVVP